MSTYVPANNCAKCHGTNLNNLKPDYPLDDCYKCHTGASTYPSSYHAAGLPYSDKPDHAVQTIDSCVQCHTKTWAAASVPYYHDVTRTGEMHQTTTTGCENCHSKSLTREHQTRTDSLGKTMTCSTCHQSADNRVLGAVKAKDSSCTL